MISLGIESTAHTFGVGVLEKKNHNENEKCEILSDSKDVYRAPEGSGIHPREAARHHVETAASVLSQALSEASASPSEVDFIAYSAGPGLGPCLRVGAVVARSLASYYGKPLVPTNHAIGHIELGKILTGLYDPLVLVISGGHTALTARQNGTWKIFGETLDLTLGQLLDQLGRFMGLSSPAGQQMEELALAAPNETILHLLPYVIKGNDVSYSGLLSAAKELLTSKKASIREIAFAVQEVSFSILAEATERALAFTGKTQLLVTGGVAANQRFSEMLSNMCRPRGVSLGVIPRRFAGDCGAQIAAAGFIFFSEGLAVPPRRSFVKQSWRMDQVNFPGLL